MTYSYASHAFCNLRIRLHGNYSSGRDETGRESVFLNIIVQTYALGLHLMIHPIDFDACTRPCSSVGALSTHGEDSMNQSRISQNLCKAETGKIYTL